MQTYDTTGAAKVLHVDPNTITDLINAGEIPAAKIGRNWVITEEHLTAYLLNAIDKQTSERRDKIEQGNIPKRTASEISQARKKHPRGYRPALPDLPTQLEANNGQTEKSNKQKNI